MAKRFDGAVGQSGTLACGRLIFGIPAAKVLITGSDSSTASRSAIGVSVAGPGR